MNAPTIRRASLVLLVIPSGLYAWLALRGPIVSPDNLDFFAFALMGLLCSAAVWRLYWQWVLTAVLVTLSAPLIKDVIQIGNLTKHFNWEATILGMLGALIGFVVGMKSRATAALLRGLRDET